VTAVDWNRYRRCPVCFAPLAQPCVQLSGSTTVLRSDRAHSSRQLRVGYARGGDER
jgi:hypothetical protein